MKPKAKKAARTKFTPCGKCLSGLVRKARGEGWVMAECECLRSWRGGKTQQQPAEARDGKAMASNG